MKKETRPMSKYENYSSVQLNEHFSNYLVNSWSYSSVSQFARNEKAFERSYIYGEKEASSATAIAGNAYHSALEFFFKELKDGHPAPDVILLKQVAFDYIDKVPDTGWKIQKTNPTVEKARATATENVSSLIDNFLAEKDVYLEDLEKVLCVEEKWECWLDINGVDIPLPCHMRVDLAIETKDGRVVLIDHKSVAAYTDEASVALTRGKQAITYFKGFEKTFGRRPDETWFIENKASKNTNGDMQLKRFTIQMDEDSQRLYEAMLYEPLRRMLQAVNDPDYVYTINDSDSFTDKGEIYSFWTRTMIAEVSDFPGIRDDKKEIVAKRLRKVRDSSLAMVNPKVIAAFQKNAKAFIPLDYSKTDMTNAEKIEHVLRTFGMAVQVKHEIKGFATDTYLLEMSAGVKIGSVKKYALDIANALDVSNVRITQDLVRYQGRSYLPVEVTKEKSGEDVLLWDSTRLNGLKIPLGVDNFGETVYWNLEHKAATPHMLIGGASGSGKSVQIRSTIEYAKLANVDRIIVCDPKRDFSEVDGIDVYNDIADIEAVMDSLVKEMNYRIEHKITDKITLVVFDELCDAMMCARKPKQLEEGERTLQENFQMILQKGRSAGFRMLAASQRADTKVLSGNILVNFSIRLCLLVPKKVDSNVIIGEAGGETLAGKGDGLIVSPDYHGRTVRFQGFYYQD